jgi:DNA polymerase
VGTDGATGREQFVAWFEPEYRIVRLAAPFFQKRFAGMDWSILTPHTCVHWEGNRLHFTAGVDRAAAPDADHDRGGRVDSAAAERAGRLRARAAAPYPRNKAQTSTSQKGTTSLEDCVVDVA